MNVLMGCKKQKPPKHSVREALPKITENFVIPLVYINSVS